MSAGPPDIFISYAREDVEWVRPLAAELERRGWQVFWDQRIPAGKSWRSHIGVRLEAARCVIVVWSEHALTSKFVLQEADVGLEREVLMPVLRQSIRPPLGFRETHAADLAAWRPGEPSVELETFLADLGEMLASSAAAEPTPVELDAEALVVDPPPSPPGGPTDGGSAAETARVGPPAATQPATRARAGPMIALAVLAIGAVGAAAYVVSRLPSGSEQGAVTQPAAPVPVDQPIVRDDLTPEQWQKVQRWLNTQGFDVGPADGAPGARTLQALEAWRLQTGKPVAGSLAAAVLAEATRPAPATGTFFTDTLKDGSPCPFCPEMVVIPAGSFTMGSPSGEADRQDDEGPQRTVAFAQPFTIGRYEVTFAQWEACVTGGSCAGYRPDDQGWGRDPRPVINVSWSDAQGFARWLSSQTGEGYRLPTEAEWEYAARGGTTTPYWTGATISTAQANYSGQPAYGSGAKGVYRGETVAADDPAFPANPFGLSHVHGNVSEWVQDCYVGDYRDAPSDGYEAIDRNGCTRRVLRGGSWSHVSKGLRSASRDDSAAVTQVNYVGFRVARTLGP